MRVSACSSSNRNAGKRARQLRLADAGRAQEDERADRPAGVLEAGSRATHGVGNGLDGLVLADDALVQRVFHADQLGLLALHQARHGMPVHDDDDARDVVCVDLFLEQTARAVALGSAASCSSCALELGQLAVLQLGGPPVVGRPLGLLDLELESSSCFLVARARRSCAFSCSHWLLARWRAR